MASRVRLSAAAAEEGTIGDTSPRQRVTIMISGNVHSGFYRVSCRNEVQFHLGCAATFEELPLLTPFSDERPRARMVVEGKQKKIESFLRWCEHGPGLITDFRQAYTVEVTEVIPAADVEGPPLKGFDVLHVLERPPLPDPEEDEQA